MLLAVLAHEPVTTCIMLAQVVGLISAIAVRVSINLRTAALFQLAYFITLSLVAVASVVAVGTHLSCWFYTSTTFAIMVLAVTWDFRGRAGAATW